MKKILAIATATMLASAGMIGTGLAQSKKSDAELRLQQGASQFAPGQQQEEPGGARELAPGQAEGPANEAAPGQQMRAAGDSDDEMATGSIGQPNFGTVISTLRSGQMDVSGVESDAQVNLVEIDELAPSGERQALDNAVADRQGDIDTLRQNLRDAGLSNLSDADIDRAVAAEVEADGSITLYTR